MTGQEAAAVGCLGAVFLALAALGRKPPSPGRGRALLLVFTVLGLGLTQLRPYIDALLAPSVPPGAAVLGAAVLPFWLLAFGARARWLRYVALGGGMLLLLLLPLTHGAAAADGAPAPVPGDSWWALLLTQDPAAVTSNLAPLAGLVLLERMITKVIAAVGGGLTITFRMDHGLNEATLKTLLHAIVETRERDEDPTTEEVDGPPDGIERRRRPRGRRPM